MLDYVKALLPYMLSIIVPILTYLLGRGQNKATTEKIKAETKKTSGEEDRSLIEFYQEQVGSLIKQVKELKELFEKEQYEKINCEERLHDLEMRFNSLSIKFSLIEKKLD